MKKKRSKAKCGWLWVGKVRGSSQDTKWPWSWRVLFTYSTETITIKITRDWKTEAGARRHGLRFMADWGIEVKE